MYACRKIIITTPLTIYHVWIDDLSLSTTLNSTPIDTYMLLFNSAKGTTKSCAMNMIVGKIFFTHSDRFSH